ncbi:MAG: hypothetical protein EON58_21525 [Alphaproteobacteria bacterium]|nr:MAG: hypothetical protein EON58_21525 [Alphaproteobacteria bacterium]
MAKTIFVEVSTTTVAPSAFTPLTSYPDSGSGAPFTFDHKPVEPGQLYIYRARRHDSTSGLYSDWAYAYVRGVYSPLSERDTTMIDPNQVWTSAYEALFVAVEGFEKVPTKAVYRVAMVSGGFDNQVDIVNSSVKRDTVTARQSTLKGMFKYSGDYQIEVRPEGGFLCFACASDKYLSTLNETVPTRYTHTYANQKGLKSLTLIHKIGDIYFVYSGVKVMEWACDDARAWWLSGISSDGQIGRAGQHLQCNADGDSGKDQWCGQRGQLRSTDDHQRG